MTENTTNAVAKLDQLAEAVHVSKLSDTAKGGVLMTCALIRRGWLHRDEGTMDDVDGLVANFKRLAATYE